MERNKMQHHSPDCRQGHSGCSSIAVNSSSVYFNNNNININISSSSSSSVTCHKKVELSQRWPRDAPYRYGLTEKFREPLTTPTVGYFTFPEIFNGFLFRSILWMFLQNLKFAALPVSGIIGGTQKNWAVHGYAHAPFSPKFLMPAFVP